MWAGLRTFEDIIDVKFRPSNVAEAPGVINFVKSNTLSPGAAGEGYAIRDWGAGAVIIKPGFAQPGSVDEGWVLGHELMHALGLNHPYEGTHRIMPQDNGPFWTNVANSITDTRPLPPGFLNTAGFEPRPLDIAALHYLYGPSKTTRTGNDVYKLDEAGANFIWDGGGGVDTIDGSHLSKGMTVNLNPGTWGHIGAKATFITAPGQITVNYGSVIENVRGSQFADVIVGNGADNLLEGLGGNDLFMLGAGADTVDGGVGIDTVRLDGTRASYQATKTGASLRLDGGAAGVKALNGVERVQFKNAATGLHTDGVAYDIAGGGIAGDTIKLLGVLGGAPLVANREIAGIGIHLRDAGMSRDQVSEMAVNALVGPSGSNADVAALLWKGYFGAAPSAAEAASLGALLDQGVYTRGSMTSAVADLMDSQPALSLTGVGSYDYQVVV